MRVLEMGDWDFDVERSYLVGTRVCRKGGSRVEMREPGGHCRAARELAFQSCHTTSGTNLLQDVDGSAERLAVVVVFFFFFWNRTRILEK